MPKPALESAGRTSKDTEEASVATNVDSHKCYTDCFDITRAVLTYLRGDCARALRRRCGHTAQISILDFPNVQHVRNPMIRQKRADNHVEPCRASNPPKAHVYEDYHTRFSEPAEARLAPKGGSFVCRSGG